ncbi:MAG: hypothetical protein MUC45_02490 [Actinomycetia bacterium]|jgi:hypothetical protein|nr:hypothetical protein [Actinomycetes bacterium]
MGGGEWPDDARVIQAVRDLGTPCTDADVARATGLPRAEVQKILVELGGDRLQVRPVVAYGVTIKVEVLAVTGE